ncbi:MAG: hypothetical protein N2999_03200 [Proteobacteria bacterium]|nr:hypothetical protein [Pseudomonadota bacterium]
MKKVNQLYHIVSIIRKLLILFSLFLVFNGWGIYSGEGAYALFMYSNLTNFSFWVIFLMGSVLLIPLGRFFCALCPVGEINYLMSKIGLNKKINLKFSILQAFTLLLVFLLVITFNISRHPHLTTILIICAFSLSAVMGLIFNGNSFCLLLCPASAFLKFYGLFSSVKLSSEGDCNVKNQCPVLLNPCDIKKEDCHLCLRCFKDSKGLKLSLTNPLKGVSLPDFNRADFFIFSVLTGLTFMAFIRVVRDVREIFVYIPYKITEILSLSHKLILPLTTFFGVFIYPLAFFILSAFLIKIFDRQSFGKYISYFIFSTLSVHMILALVKINSRIKFLPYAVLDPSGKDVVTLRLAYNFDIPGDIIPIEYFRIILFILPVFFYSAGMVKIFKEKLPVTIPLGLLFTFIFFFIEYIIIKWLFVFI